MMLRKYKTAVRAAIAYLILTGGLWMFLSCCANSYNRLSEEKISPLLLTVGDDSAQLYILGKEYDIGLNGFSADNRECLIAYMLAPDEVRAAFLAAEAVGG